MVIGGLVVEIFDNVNRIVKDDLEKEIKKNSRVSITAACFSIYAFQELREQLEDIDELRFIFTSPTFTTEKAPKTSKNFIDLIQKNYYSGVTFHRVIDGFMIQGGDPTGTGRGGPGYQIEDEFNSDLTHKGEGILSMANAGPNTGGSQFFITLGPTPHLDGRHAVFGKVVEGMDVVDKIKAVATGRSGMHQDVPKEDVVIKSVTVSE